MSEIWSEMCGQTASLRDVAEARGAKIRPRTSGQVVTVHEPIRGESKERYLAYDLSHLKSLSRTTHLLCSRQQSKAGL